MSHTIPHSPTRRVTASVTTDLHARKSPLGNGPTCWAGKASDLWKSVSEGSEFVELLELGKATARISHVG